MKKVLIAILLALSVPAVAQIKSASLTASGLTCSMCSKAIYKALVKVPSIQNVIVDIKNSKYEIEFKRDADVVIEDVRKAVEDAGFSVSVLQVRANFQNVVVSNDGHAELSGNSFHFLDIGTQTLNGEKMFTVVNKNYVSEKEFKKISKQAKAKCIATSAIASCGPTGGYTYHVTL